jgi:endonuclease VIII
VPEGDTLFRTAAVLRQVLLGRLVSAARGRPDGVQLERVVGSTVTRVEAQGKHLLIDFSNGLTLHTHLRMHGSWHRYRPWETWKRSPSRAVAVIGTPNAVAVCFDAPTAELLETRALALHPQLSTLGPDLLAPEPDLERAIANLAQPSRAETPVGEALLDQSLMAGLGNVYRSEVLFLERVDPFLPLGRLAPGTAERLVRTGARLLHANRLDPDRTTTPDALGGAPGAGGPRRAGEPHLHVYGNPGRPCPRCAARIRTRVFGALPRRVFWCPGCQPPGAGGMLDEVPVPDPASSPPEGPDR